MKRILGIICIVSALVIPSFGQIVYPLDELKKTKIIGFVTTNDLANIPPNTVTSLWTHIVWEAKTNWTGMNINGLEAGVVVTNFSACFVWEGHTNNIWQKVEMSSLAVWKKWEPIYMTNINIQPPVTWGFRNAQ